MSTSTYILILEASAVFFTALLVFLLFIVHRKPSKKAPTPSDAQKSAPSDAREPVSPESQVSPPVKPKEPVSSKSQEPAPPNVEGAYLVRSAKNPILEPNSGLPWENAAVFNPAAFYDGKRVHVLYRALGMDGVSRIGCAAGDGINFERYPSPAFEIRTPSSPKFRNPFAEIGRYNVDAYASGGGWSGSEDPRTVLLDGRVYMNFTVFESWKSIRIALTSINLEDFKARVLRWEPHFFISPANETHKNWVLFPEKIRGKFAILHALTPEVLIDYADSPHDWEKHPIKSNNHRGGRKGHWDEFVRGAAAPPIRTKYGWLLLYHAMNPKEGHGYKVGAMLLDLDRPTKIIHRSGQPILEPKEWYDNDWKPGVVYATGAIVKDETLFVYYGGGDKRVNLATVPLEAFLRALIADKGAPLV